MAEDKMPSKESKDKRQAAKEVIDLLEEIATLLVGTSSALELSERVLTYDSRTLD